MTFCNNRTDAFLCSVRNYRQQPVADLIKEISSSTRLVPLSVRFLWKPLVLVLLITFTE